MAFWSKKGPPGTWGSTWATVLSLEGLVWAAGGAKHKGLRPLTILVHGKEVKQGEVSEENADRLPRFDFNRVAVAPRLSPQLPVSRLWSTTSHLSGSVQQLRLL